jgi:hypothetical protein
MAMPQINTVFLEMLRPARNARSFVVELESELGSV